MKNRIIALVVGIVLLLFSLLFAQWEPDVRLTFDDSSSTTSFYNTWCIAAAGSTIHVVWHDNRDGNNEIYYKRSIDSGVSWGIDTRLTNDAGNSAGPSISVSNSIVHVVWTDNRGGKDEIYYKRSADGGTSWGIDTKLSDQTEASNFPTVTSLGSYVFAVWEVGSGVADGIYFKRSTDGGSTWGADTCLPSNPVSTEFPSVSASDSNVHVVWEDRRGGADEIFYKHSTNYGISWSADTRLTFAPELSWYPSIAASGSFVHIVWMDYRDGVDKIFYKRSTDGGTTWGIDTMLSNASGQQGFPSIAVSGSYVHVVWHDNRNGWTEIYYKNSTDNGTSWGTDTRLTNEPGYSSIPSVSVSNSIVHVVWTDDRDGNDEIYYKRNPTGNAIAQKDSHISGVIHSKLLCIPNPFMSSTRIQLHGEYDGKQVLLNIHDSTGRLVKSVKLETGTYQLGADLVPGIYFLKLNGKPIGKVVKVR